MNKNIKVVVVDDRSWKERVKDKWFEFKFVVKEKTDAALIWLSDNWFEIAKVLVVVIPIVTNSIKLVKTIQGTAAERHEDRMSRCYYDPSTGMHWDLRRNLTNAERSEIVSRKRNGEYTEEILKDLRLLRR